MQVKDFDYYLPPELIAQKPSDDRCASRLLTIDRERGAIAESRFADIVEFLKPGDLLVVNDTRVIPARLHGVKESGGRVEVFLVRKIEHHGEVWDCLIRASKPPRSAVRMLLADGMTASVIGRGEGECWRVAFSPAEGFRDWLEREGSMPLPPYIKRQAEIGDRERYQTVFARVEGAVAAPTAGLHFTPELIKLLSERGVDLVSLTLHVGLGTFLPMRVDDVREHRMHRESYCISEATAAAINDRRKGGGRVVAVGTTVVRTLEQAALSDGAVPAGAGEADIFIFPGYKFKVVDALITNFHLPQSTLLMLVSAFAGKQLLFRAYNEAVARKFRFFSYGDAMFIG